jgi:hypothetical protein
MNIEDCVIPNTGQEFRGDDFRELVKPGVYVAMLGDEPLYIGMSKNLLRRAASSHRRAINECDRILLYPCVSVWTARELEAILIAKLRPKYNKRLHLARIVARRLGMSESAVNTWIKHGIVQTE